MSLLEFTLRCTGCGLRWVVFGEKPGESCVFCGSRLVKAKRA